jgi:hypothetical protein
MIAKLSPPELGRKQILGCRYDHAQKSVSFFQGAIFPSSRQLTQHGLGHEVDVPAVSEFKLAADHGVVSKQRDLFVLSDGIGIHAVLGKRLLNAFPVGVPEQSR